MRAFNLQNKGEYYAMPADQYTRMIMDAAEYYIDYGKHILLLVPADEIDGGCLYRYFEIDGKKYFSIATQSHDNLMKIFESQKYIQERLF